MIDPAKDLEPKPSSSALGVIDRRFFEGPASRVARELIGVRLVRRLGNRRLALAITETEAYEGEHDLASHSSRGRTARTEIMFGPAGHFYIYRIYGLHWMLNIVTGDVGEAAAVLIRGMEGVTGPGRVATALEIDATLNGKPASPASGLWFEYPEGNGKPRIRRTARIGVEYAGPIWANKKLRFVRS
jgi:DNA-3-methyladenine glycosylase